MLCAGKPVVDPKGEIAAFCDSTNQWLPLLCTMNVTVATELVRSELGWSHEQFSWLRQGLGRIRRSAAAPLSGGERTPNIPHGTGVCWAIAQRPPRLDIAPEPPWKG